VSKYLVIIIFLLLPSVINAQQIYKWKDEKGQWHYSNAAPSDVANPGKESVPGKTCAPLEVGETRRFKKITRSPDFPHLELIDFQIRLVESIGDSSTFSWRAVVKNTAMERETVRGSMGFSDCDEFLLADETVTPTAIEASSEATITGTKQIFGAASSKVGRFSISLRGSNPIARQTGDAVSSPGSPASTLDELKKPDVRVSWSELRKAGGGVYFTGEVKNWGHGTASRVKVVVQLKNQHGVNMISYTAEVEPSDLRYWQEGFFNIRIPSIHNTSGIGWTSEAKWSP